MKKLAHDTSGLPDRHAHGARPARPIDAEALERAAGLLRAAGDPGRLRLLVRLLDGEMCVSELAEDSGDEISLVSQRLRTLRTEKLVNRRREGKHIFYDLCDPHVVALVRLTMEHALEAGAYPHDEESEA